MILRTVTRRDDSSAASKCCRSHRLAAGAIGRCTRGAVARHGVAAVAANRRDCAAAHRACVRRADAVGPRGHFSAGGAGPLFGDDRVLTAGAVHGADTSGRGCRLCCSDGVRAGALLLRPELRARTGEGGQREQAGEEQGGGACSEAMRMGCFHDRWRFEVRDCIRTTPRSRDSLAIFITRDSSLPLSNELPDIVGLCLCA